MTATSRTSLRRLTPVAALIGLVVAAAPPGPAQAAAGPPSIAGVAPRILGSGAKLTVSGHGFVPGSWHNAVIFLGRPGIGDDVRVGKTNARGTAKLVLRAPPARIKQSGLGAVSGPILVVNKHGRSKPTRFKLGFDDDRDGWANEKELAEGTDPRKPDTDGDGTVDSKDADPLNRPGGSGGQPPVPLPPPPGEEGPETYDCDTRGPVVSGVGLTSSLEGLANVIGEGRPRIGHGAYGGTGFTAICLLRKKRGEPDSTYHVVGTSNQPLAGVIQDNERVFKGIDYVYRTDVIADVGHLPGASTLSSRGAGSIANVDGWAQIEQNCTQCGSSSAQSGSLRSTIVSKSASDPGAYVGQVAVYKDRVAPTYRPKVGETNEATVFEARPLVLAAPSKPGTHIGARLNLSVEHPGEIRDDNAGTVADLRGSDEPWISVELRSYANGTVTVVARDEAGEGVDDVIAESPDLSAAGLHNVFLIIQMSGPGRYEVRYKANTGGEEDQVLDLDPGSPAKDRPLPGAMPEAWLSLANEMNRAELATHDVRFDEVHAVYQTDYRDLPNESFGGTGVNVKLPPGFDAIEIASGLNGPTAIDFAANGDMYLSQREGKVFRLDSAATEGPGNNGLFEEVLDITAFVNSGPYDQGLLGFVLDPDFESNGFFYAYYTIGHPTEEARTVSRVERFRVDPGDGIAHLEDPLRKVIVGADAPAPGSGDSCPPGPTSDCLPSDTYTHSAGGLQFGSDGALWISTPDGASPDLTDPLALRSVNPDSLAGKILRVDPATGEGVPGNPKYASEVDKASPRARTWAMGFRNPFRLAERPDAPGSWYVTDVGWGAWEELDVIPGTASAGVVPNYGWPCYEGTPASPYKDVFPSECAFAGPVAPLHEYDSSLDDHAIIGAAFYTGAAYPSPWKPGPGQAAFYYGDFPSGDIIRVLTGAADEKLDVSTFASGFTTPVMLIEGPVDRTVPGGDQTLYLVDLGPTDEVGGKVWRLSYEGP